MVQFGDFEWDPDKAEVNFKKHRVSFFEGATVFQDPDVVIEPDPVHSDEEWRAIAIGFSASSRVLLVVHTERQKRIRLISARNATREERRRYDTQFE
jgi:uncharacterized DUF497 family protein